MTSRLLLNRALSTLTRIPRPVNVHPSDAREQKTVHRIQMRKHETIYFTSKPAVVDLKVNAK